MTIYNYGIMIDGKTNIYEYALNERHASGRCQALYESTCLSPNPIYAYYKKLLTPYDDEYRPARYICKQCGATVQPASEPYTLDTKTLSSLAGFIPTQQTTFIFKKCGCEYPVEGIVTENIRQKFMIRVPARDEEITNEEQKETL